MLVLLLIIIIIDLLMTSANELEGKVVKGQKAHIMDHPYSAFISVVGKSNNIYVAHICGSSIINQKILLSAAHCFETLTKASKVKGNFGNTDKRKGYVIKINKVKVHPQYDERKIVNDIALAGLQNQLTFSDTVTRVAVATAGPNGGVATLAGWGLVNEMPMQSTNVLHETEQKILTRQNCMKILNRIPPGTFCGGTKTQRSYPSVGDSGSPLVMNGYLQIGLVSFKKMDISRSVIIYTDVAYFYDWIVENAGVVYCG